MNVTEAELKRMQDFDIDQEELERCKSKLNSSVIIGGESTNERMMGLISSWLTRGHLETLEEIRQRIESVTLDDLHALVEEFPLWPRQVVSAGGPMSPDALQLPA